MREEKWIANSGFNEMHRCREAEAAVHRVYVSDVVVLIKIFDNAFPKFAARPACESVVGENIKCAL